MTAKTTTFKRILSLMLSFMLAFGGIPVLNVTADAVITSGLTSTDDETNFNGWTNYYPVTGILTTENAGGIWTNKNVLGENNETAAEGDMESFSYSGGSISPANNNFLIGLSAIGSNMSVTGQSATPMDTVFILDVSNSMDATEIGTLVDATNESIAALLGNGNAGGNRVGVVLYSGSSSGNNSDAATAILPLDSYSAGTGGKYLTNNGREISVAGGLTVSGSQGRPGGGATYIQRGLYAAQQQLTPESVGNPENRIPIIVLMSDGAPTLGTTNYKNASGDNNIGNGSDARAGVAFITQLTAIHTKAAVKEKYGKDCLFYTVGFGLNSIDAGTQRDLATSVVNPASRASSTVNNLWNDYNTATSNYWSNGNIYMYIEDGYYSARVTVDTAYRYYGTADSTNTGANGQTLKTYVDRYFAANNADDLTTAFAQVVAEIQLQASYNPTLVEGAEEFSGYVSFVDEIGKYMEVKDVEGVVIGNKLYSGANFANVGDPDSNGYLLGSGADGSILTEAGAKYINSIVERLGLDVTNQTDVERVETLVRLAIENNQIDYTTGSNYIGWYTVPGATANSEVFGGFHGPNTTLPDTAISTNKSYFYWGEGTVGDLMFLTVRVITNLTTGKQTVAVGIPASILPVVSYQVELEANGNVKGLTVKDANVSPIHVFYEVGLEDRLNAFNLYEIMAEESKGATPGSGGDYVGNMIENGVASFYSNTWQPEGTANALSYGTKNTYSYFSPSHENNRYYYQENTRVYTDTNGTPYSGSSAPSASGTYYHQTKYYTTDSNEPVIKYDELHGTTAASATGSGDQWYISKDTVHRDYAEHGISKQNNTTGTLQYAFYPYADVRGNNSQDDLHSATYGVIHGNNGKLTYTLPKGIEIAKVYEGTDVPAANTFRFTVGRATANGVYNVQRSESASAGTLTADGNGDITFTIAAGESIIILGLENAVTVTESTVPGYRLSNVKLDGADAANGVSVTPSYEIPNVTFTNVPAAYGNFILTKEVNIAEGFTGNSDAVFTFDVTVTGADGEFDAKHSGDATVTKVNVTSGTAFTVTLKHGQQYEILDLPEGATVKVVENTADGTMPAGYKLSQYWTNNTQVDGVDSGATVTIGNNNTQSVIAVNEYPMNNVSVKWNLALAGTKTLTGKTWDTETFTFHFEEYINGAWEPAGATEIPTTANVDKPDSGNSNTFTFANLPEIKFDRPGRYFFRVVEVVGNEAGMEYDTAAHGIIVNVEDNGQGGLVIESVTKSDQTLANAIVVTEPAVESTTWGIQANFTNVYNATEANATAVIQKTVNNQSNSQLATLDGFTFSIYEGTKGADGTITYSDTAVTIDGKTAFETMSAGTVRITQSFDVDDIGTKYFKVVENKDTKVGNTAWNYTEAPKYFAVEIVNTNTEDPDGAAILRATAYETDENGTAIGTQNTTSEVGLTFTNTYEAASVVIAPSVNKVLTGRKMAADEFTFNMYYWDSAATNPSRELVAVGKNIEAESGVETAVTFDTNATNTTGKFRDKGTNPDYSKLYFDKVGIYTFIVVEDASNPKGGITYDGTVYQIIVTVTDVNGALQASVAVMNQIDGEETPTITFRNGYKTARSAEIGLNGTKTLTGRPLLNDEFTFIMQEMVEDGNGGYTAKAVEPYKAYNTAPSTTGEAKFGFQKISYETAGTYYYEVYEQKPAAGQPTYGITYSEDKYFVTDVVEDKGNGVLEVNRTVTKNGKEFNGEEIAFTNTYKAAPTSAAIGATKTFEGYVEGSKTEFEFEIYNSNEKVEKVSLISDTITNDPTTGSITFLAGDENKYTEAGTYYYIVREKKGTEKLIIYDEREYFVRVEVSDDNKGVLKAETSVFVITEDEAGEEIIVPVDEIRFNNIFKIEGTTPVYLSGEKILQGRELKAGEFTFLLYEADKDFNITGDYKATTNDAEGRFELVTKSFTREDAGKTFYYVVKEQYAGQVRNNVTYSDVVYRVAITVSLDNDTDKYVDGVKTETIILNNEDASVMNNALDFTNTYKDPNPPYRPPFTPPEDREEDKNPSTGAYVG